LQVLIAAAVCTKNGKGELACRSIPEKQIVENAFNLIFAFDEIVALGKPKKQKELPPTLTSGKCSFLKSLEGQVSRDRADNEAFFYRENFAKNKDQLAQHLYKMFNAQVFNNELDVPITWSKLLRNTAGRCMNKRK